MEMWEAELTTNINFKKLTGSLKKYHFHTNMKLLREAPSLHNIENIWKRNFALFRCRLTKTL